jgi:hypothetical protein
VESASYWAHLVRVNPDVRHDRNTNLSLVVDSSLCARCAWIAGSAVFSVEKSKGTSSTAVKDMVRFADLLSSCVHDK